MYQRLKLKQTAAALNGVPSLNFTPVRRLNVHEPVRLACPARREHRHDLVVPGFSPTRPWKIWTTTRSDSPSDTSGPSMMTGSAEAPNTSALLACFELVAALATAAMLTLSAAMPTSNPSFFSPMLSYLLLESSIQYSRVRTPFSGRS